MWKTPEDSSGVFCYADQRQPASSCDFNISTSAAVMPDVSSSSTSPNLKYPVLSISDAVRTAPSGSAQRDRNVDADPWSVAVIFIV